MSEDNYDEEVFQMLYKCNRPTAKSEIAATFKGEISAANIQSSLNSLESAGRVITKLYGKTKIYLVNQEVFMDESKIELDQKIEKYSKENEVLRSKLDSLNGEIEVVDGMLSIEELHDGIRSLSELTAANEVRLRDLKSGGREVSKEDMTDAVKTHGKTMAMLRKVRRIFNQMIETLSEGMDMKKAQLYEEMGIEMG